MFERKRMTILNAGIKQLRIFKSKIKRKRTLNDLVFI